MSVGRVLGRVWLVIRFDWKVGFRRIVRCCFVCLVCCCDDL